MTPARMVVRDTYQGTLHLRSKRDEYLPRDPAEKSDHYSVRLSRAVLFNALVRTHASLVGKVFRKEPKLSEDVPEVIRGAEGVEGHAENIDNAGTHWTVFAKEVFGDALLDGHAFIYVDMPPPLPEGSTLADERAAGMRPYWVSYTADQAINWRTEVVAGQTRLSQITFRECTQEADGAYGETEVIRYRVLRPGSWELYREWTENGTTQYLLEAAGVSPLPEIPVAVIYARKTGILQSAPPLLDLAVTNLQHYSKYSDLSVALHLAIPFLGAKGRNRQDSIQAIGHYSLIDVATDGDLWYVEPSGTCLAPQKADLDQIEQWMAALGVSIIAGPNPQPTTATEELIDSVQEESDLATAARSLKDGLEQALKFHAQYLDRTATSGGSVELGATWQEMTLAPEEMRVWLDSAANIFSRDTIYKVFQRAGKLPEDFDPDTESATVEAEAEARAVRAERMFNRGVVEPDEDA